jgi:hypothetical protein
MGVSTREQVIQAAAELRKLVDRIEQEALAAIDKPTAAQLIAFDAHRRVIDSTLTILRRTVARRVEREQSQTEPEDASATGPHPTITTRPTTRPSR